MQIWLKKEDMTMDCHKNKFQCYPSQTLPYTSVFLYHYKGSGVFNLSKLKKKKQVTLTPCQFLSKNSIFYIY